MSKTYETKVITSDSVGAGTSGVLPVGRLPKITPEPRQPVGKKPKK